MVYSCKIMVFSISVSISALLLSSSNPEHWDSRQVGINKGTASQALQFGSPINPLAPLAQSPWKAIPVAQKCPTVPETAIMARGKARAWSPEEDGSVRPVLSEQLCTATNTAQGFEQILSETF